MKRVTGKRLACFLLGMMLTGSMAVCAAASEDDNSLYSLGLMTDGAVSEQEVEYGVFEFDVIVPAGTDELELDPIPSNENARISAIEGTELDEDGNGTVLVTVTAPNGDPFTYTIHVTSLDEEPEVQTEPPTQAPTEPETEKKKEEKPAEPETETEEKLYVEVPRDTVTQAQNTITELQNEIIEYRENVNLYQKIMYVLLAVSIIFLFIIINLLLRNRDLKAELKEYRSLGYVPAGKNKDKKGQSGSGSQGGQNGQNSQSSQGNPGGQSAGPGQGSAPVPGAAGDGAAQTKHSVYYEKAPLDVTPQTSTRSKRLPEYEQGTPAPADAPASAGTQAPAGNQAPAGAQAPAGNQAPAAAPAPGTGKGAPAPSPKKDKSGVQVDMIDL